MIARRVMRGVTALMMPARIEVTSVSARANNTPGITFSKSETTQRCAHNFPDFGSEIRLYLAQANKVRAPSAQRPKATPNGVKKSRPSLMNINEQPQTTPSAR
jgi:hypothetical protein